jgi:glycosyltransferase involved in cell wall biosynthesis
MLYLFTKSTRGAGGSRHRAFLVADFLRAAGHSVELVVPPVYHTETTRLKARVAYVRALLSLRRGDTVFLQNTIFSTYFIVAIYIVKLIFRPTIVFDFDDATWVQNPVAPRALARIADKYIVASHFLATWPWLRKKPVLIMPNLVDYTLAEKYTVERAKGKVVLGWIGGAPNSLPNLEILVPVFRKLAEKNLPVTFKLVGAGKSDAVRKLFADTGIETELVDSLEWGKEGEIQKANSSFDIGLCPLVDNESNRGRCSLKVLDYMAAGIPVVISPVGENTHFVQNGVEGYLPQATEEWVRDLVFLIQNTEQRKEVGQRAKQRLEKEFSYQANIEKYIQFIYPSISNHA